MGLGWTVLLRDWGSEITFDLSNRCIDNLTWTQKPKFVQLVPPSAELPTNLVIHKSSVVCDYCGHTVTLKMIYEAIFWNAKPLLFKKACYKHLQSQGPCTYLAVSACSWSPRTSGSSLEVSRKHTSPLLPPTQSCTRDSDRESQKKRREKAGKTGEAVRLCTWEKREKKRRGAWGNWSP